MKFYSFFQEQDIFLETRRLMTKISPTFIYFLAAFVPAKQNNFLDMSIMLKTMKLAVEVKYILLLFYDSDSIQVICVFIMYFRTEVQMLLSH